MAAVTANASTPSDSRSISSPLLRLAPELRNRIYSYMFEPEVAEESDDELELHHAINATCPHSNLPAANRQSYAETASLLKNAQERYWRTHVFLIKTSMSGDGGGGE
jgi:hypothetical protein